MEWYWMAGMFGATCVLVWLEPGLRAGLLKWMIFIVYLVSWAWFAVYAASYGGDVGMGLELFAAAGVSVVLAVLYMAFATHKREVTSDEIEHEAHASNYVPAKPPKRYRSVTRRTLNAIKIARPREHWRVRA